MSRSLGNVIADSLELGLGYAERLLVDVRAEDFGRLAQVGDQTVLSNHGAFVLGHLSLYPARILEHIGQNAGPAATPQKFTELFSKDATCQDDLASTLYPPKDEIVEAFFAGYRAAVAALREASDAALAEPNPNEGMSERFPTVGSMFAFYAGGHLMLHLGQMSAWRRMRGLGPA